MKKHLSFFVLFAFLSGLLFSKSNPLVHLQQSSLYPPKTIVIKHPAASDVNRYFAEVTVLRIEIYKVGTKVDLDKILTDLRKDKAVESIELGSLNGDFQAINISLKQGQGKKWFVSWLKSAGFSDIKINNEPVTKLEYPNLI